MYKTEAPPPQTHVSQKIQSPQNHIYNAARMPRSGNYRPIQLMASPFTPPQHHSFTGHTLHVNKQQCHSPIESIPETDRATNFPIRRPFRKDLDEMVLKLFMNNDWQPLLNQHCAVSHLLWVHYYSILPLQRLHEDVLVLVGPLHYMCM